MIDVLLHCRYLIPVIPENCVLENHSMAITNGAIADLLPRHEAEKKYRKSRNENGRRNRN